MTPVVGAGAFFSVTLALAVLPFVPALLEWRRRTDAVPLLLEHDSTVSPRLFATRFRSYVTTHLKKELDACAERGSGSEILLPDRVRGRVVHRADSLLWTDGEPRARSVDKLVASCTDLQLPSRTFFSHEIYASGSVYAGDDVVCRAILAEGDLFLGARAIVLRWAHAGGELRVGPGSKLYGRQTADREIFLEGECSFERLHAPRIECGRNGAPGPEADANLDLPDDRVPLRPENLSKAVEVAGNRWLVPRNLDVPPGALVPSDLVATGSARIGRGARIDGSVKSHGDLYLEEDVVVRGSVVSERSVILSRGCRVLGPILAEESVYLRAGSFAGTVLRPTTVSAWRIVLEIGAVVHGTIWTRNEARVVATAEGFPE